MGSGDKGVELLSYIICDDIRTENNGKAIFLGVYNDDLVVGDLPATISQLSFYIKCRVGGVGDVDFTFSILTPTGETIGPLKGSVPVSVIGGDRFNAAVQVKVAPFTLSSAGRYRVELTVDGYSDFDLTFDIRQDDKAIAVGEGYSGDVSLN